jgi:hypothetical protein
MRRMRTSATARAQDRLPIIARVATSVVAALVTTSVTLAQERVPVVRAGDTVQFEFEEPPFNGEGVRSLSALRGRAVLLVYWTPTCSSCTGIAVPEALRFAQEHSDVVSVVCVGYMVSSPQAMLAFAAEKGWIRPGVPALWTLEMPCDLGFWRDGMDPQGQHIRLPAALLLDEHGKVVIAGGYSALRNGGVLADTVAGIAGRLRLSTNELPKPIAVAWRKQRDGNAGKAVDALAGSLAGGGEPEADRLVLQRCVSYWRMQADLVRQDLDRGHVHEARTRLADIRNALAGSTEMSFLLQELDALESECLGVREREAEKALLKLRLKLARSGPGAVLVNQLNALANKYEGTRSGGAARRLAFVAAGNPDDVGP